MFQESLYLKKFMLHNMRDMEWFFQYPNPKSGWYIPTNTFTKLAVLSFSTAHVIGKT